jgi:hypothetical protein
MGPNANDTLEVAVVQAARFGPAGHYDRPDVFDFDVKGMPPPVRAGWA